MSRVKTLGTTTAFAVGFVGALSMIVAVRGSEDLRITDPVPAANPSNAALVQPDLVAGGFALRQVVQGTDPLENPSDVITTFGNLNNAARTKTEPDQNTYLVFDEELPGPTPGFHYGHHFLFQGHENAGNLAYMTRINLDVTDPAHRITLLSPVGANGLTGFNSVDGSTWDPFSRTLLFTQEAGAAGGVVEISNTWPPRIRNFDGSMGKASYEGVQLDDKGNVLLIEDTGGVTVNVVRGDTTSPKTARQPNSFIFRFEPSNTADLSAGGRLFALQVTIMDHPLVFHAADPVGDVFSDDQLQLHTLGTTWPAKWVLLHDTATDGTAPFDANALAKTKLATPFKRPENAKFLPKSNFDTFFVAVTGDTDAAAGNALASRGAWGSIFRVDFPNGSADGSVSIVVLGDADHASFDNVTFADDKIILTTEDRGDGLHDQLNALDSVWAFDIHRQNRDAARLIALGRDATAADEDNEPTGIHVSDGASTIEGLLGAREPGDARVSHSGSGRGHEREDEDLPARTFVTKQHGDNKLFEIVQTQKNGGRGKN